MKIRTSKLVKFIPIIIFFTSLIMSIGFASVNSIITKYSGEAIAKAHGEVFITDISYVDDGIADTSSYDILYADNTILKSKIVLEENNVNSQVSLKVHFYNSSSSDYMFKDIVFADDLIDEDIYSNLDIVYTFDKQDEVISKNGGEMDVIITFKYDQITEETSNVLNSLLNFKFVLLKYVNVNFNANGGKVSPSSKEYLFDCPYGELPTPVREGYTFTGWALEKEGKEIITENNIVSIDGEHTLYAQWNAKSYSIRFNANGGTGTMVDQTIKYDAIVPLSKNTFEKSGYKFLGWALSEDGDKVYNDMDNVVNLQLEGIVDLYALWAEDTYTVTFDYNGGTGSVNTMQVVYGDTYGALPEYPFHQDSIFTGWYTAKSGGTQVIPSTKVSVRENHTLYAHWEVTQYNDAIKNIVIKNVPDQNYDGVVDSIYLNFTCSSSFEKYNIPLKNLIVGQKYKISYTASNNASFGESESGYKGSFYGSIITQEAELKSGSIKDEAIADGGLIAQWSDYSKGDKWLNGPFELEMTFVAEATNMYWTWDFGLMEDGIPYDFNITNIKLEIVPPTINFSNKSLVLYSSSLAAVKNDVVSTYSNSFVFDGDSYAETLYYPITDLTAGSTYTITFEHLYSGKLIDDSAKTSTLRYEYGSGIMNTAPTKYGSFMSNLGTYASNTFVKTTVDGVKDTITFTFTPSGTTAYWVWNMANCSDSYDNPISIKVTKFSVKHKSGGSITYYSSS